MTVKTYCMQGQHMVDEEKISHLVTPKGRRRMCSDCKSAALDRLKQEKADKLKEPKPR